MLNGVVDDNGLMGERWIGDFTIFFSLYMNIKINM